MNMVVVLKQNDTLELVTAPLDGTILPGVTRDSILQIAKDTGEFKVSERYLTMEELLNHRENGSLVECFGCGTAAVVSPIQSIKFHGRVYDIPLAPENPSTGVGYWTNYFWETMSNIQYGKIEHDWSLPIGPTL